MSTAPPAWVASLCSVTFCSHYSHLGIADGTPIPAQWTCRRRCRDRADIETDGLSTASPAWVASLCSVTFFLRSLGARRRRTADDPRRSEGALKTRLTPRPFFSDATLRFDLAPRRSPSAGPESRRTHVHLRRSRRRCFRIWNGRPNRRPYWRMAGRPRRCCSTHTWRGTSTQSTAGSHRSSRRCAPASRCMHISYGILVMAY